MFGGPIAGLELALDFGINGIIALAVWVFGLMILLHIFGRIIDRESAKRSGLVRVRLQALAEERKRLIDEGKTFYASPEWKLLRNEVISEQGRRCGVCGTTAIRDRDVTVDHIRPRSKHPHLALSKDNLQVLCRSCNARKGNREGD